MSEELRRLSKRQLIRLIEQVMARVAVLEQRVQQLEHLERRNAELEAEVARLRKNSSTSSKPPSSDIVKPPPSTPTRRAGKRRAGGQPGHARHERPSFPPAQLDAVWDYTLSTCPDCGGGLRPAAVAPRVVQQIELVEQPVRLEEHRAFARWCRRCQKVHWSSLPAAVVHGGLVGPRLSAHLGYLKGVCHASYRTLQQYAQDVLGVSLSTGQLAKVIGKVAAALAVPYEELAAALPYEARLNVDETGHKDRGARYWAWCFRAPHYTLFKIDPSRGSEVLREMLGEEFAAYRKYMGDCGVLVQFCLAHLIREVKYLTTLPHPATVKYGHHLLARLRHLFGVIHRRERLSPGAFQRLLEQARKKLVFTATHPPRTRDAHNLATRFRRHGEAYFRFITTPGIEPTNNLAEQALRFVVIDRRITQGTRGLAGRQWAERIWTTIATCGQQGRSVWVFLQQAIQAHFIGRPPPSLLMQPA